MKRKLFTTASVISLLLCLATASLWVRSYWYYDSVSYGRAGANFYELSSMSGHICAEIGSPATDGFWFSPQPIERGMVEPWGDTNALGFRVNPSRTVIIFAVLACRAICVGARERSFRSRHTQSIR